MVNIRIEDLEGDLSEGISDDDTDIGNSVVSGDGTATNDDVFSSGEDYAFSPISDSDLDVESEGFSVQSHVNRLSIPRILWCLHLSSVLLWLPLQNPVMSRLQWIFFCQIQLMNGKASK